MPATISVAMSTQTGPPKRETVIVHCALEFDDDFPTLQDPESIRPILCAAINACREALHVDDDANSRSTGHRSCAAPPRYCSLN
jgi:hypothetical protein